MFCDVDNSRINKFKTKKLKKFKVIWLWYAISASGSQTLKKFKYVLSFGFMKEKVKTCRKKSRGSLLMKKTYKWEGSINIYCIS